MAGHARTVDEYLAGLHGDTRAALEKVRKAIKAAAPKVEECISYGMPAFRLDGKLVAGFAAAKGHCGYYPMSGATIASLRAELAGYQASKGAIRFSTERVLPAALIRKLVKTRIAEVTPSGAGRTSRTASSRRSATTRRTTR